jgi:hypothetical protein
MLATKKGLIFIKGGNYIALVKEEVSLASSLLYL